MMDSVWYACYGSNINRYRFMKYIHRCDDTTPSSEDRPFEFAYNMYFAKSAVCWDRGGKAFLDLSKPGHAYGRIYRITGDQYEQIKYMEGSDYRQKVDLGIDDGIPVYTFTDTQTNTDHRLPSYRYYDVILNGLYDCRGTQLSEQEIRKYLNQCIMDDTTLKVTETIRTGTHCLTNQEIMNLTGYDRNMVHTAVQWLIGKGMICQDGRSVHMHHALDDPQAFFHTVKGYCARDLLDAILSGK